MNKNKLWIAALVLVLAAALGFVASHSFIDGKIYAKYGDSLDLRGSGITAEHYELVREAFPDRQILWDVPFQGGTVAHDSRQLTLTRLSGEDLAALDYLQQLQTVDARGCRDYEQLEKLRLSRPQVQVLYTVTVDGTEYDQDAGELTVKKLTEEDVALLRYLPELTVVRAEDCRDYELLVQLREQYPQVQLSYRVEIDGNLYPQDTTRLSFTGISSRELMDMLRYLPRLEQVAVVEPDCREITMPQVAQAYPQISFYWEREVLGLRVTSQDTQLDLSDRIPESLEELERQLRDFPGLERVYLGHCRLDNDELAAYRDRVREDYKVVWNILIGAEYIDTDATWFMPGKTGRGLMEHQAVLLKYCEDMICIDIGHKLVETCDFVRYMPNLKYLIIACSNLKDLTPISTCQNLIYLEIQVTPVVDYSPLLECKSLEDLNISMTWGDPEPLYQMTWLKRLHWTYHIHLLEEFEKALPNTELMLAIDENSVGQGWRQHPHYYEMRDILGMYYMP